MAEILLGALIQPLVEHLVSPALLNLANRKKVAELVKKWTTKMKSISNLLEDAEDKAMRGKESVQLWLDELRDLVYDIEDVVDEFATEEGIRSTEAAAVTGNKVSTLLLSCCTGLSPRKIIADQELRSKMEEIGGRLDSILEQKKDLELSESSGSTVKKTSNYSSQRMTTSVPEYHIVGRQEDEKVVLSKLLTDETEDLSVTPVVGMGGLGKTTLIKSVFNHSAVVEAFPLRGWACVSDNFSKLGIARALLVSLTGRSGGDDLNGLHNKLREILCKQKFLIVLDDYWNKNYNNWDEMYNLFKLGVKGSKVIVTTRDTGVASMMTKRPPIHLQKLSLDDCLALLAYHALGVSTFDAHSHLKSIGEAIAGKCKGLPLAAKALGGLLRSKQEITTEWEDIRDSKIWNLEPGKDDIFRALKLSYIHLPSHLKRCFVYCAIFPEDHEFDRDELVLLWMAEGFVERNDERKGKLDQGRKQFDELMNRSFFQRSTRNESKFVMHDLMHDLASSIGGNTCLNVELHQIEDVMKYKSPEKVRHLSYPYRSRELDSKFEKCHVLKGLRTFLELGTFYISEISDKALEALFQNLKNLRAFHLRGFMIEKIPNCIGRLNHLRYLSFLNNSSLRKLPESICSLYNLETLILRGCRQLTALPPGMDKLLNLKCLDIRGTTSLEKMPVELGQMHNFEILTKFIVGRQDGLRLKGLRHSQHLQGELSILNLRNVEDTKDAKDAGLNAKVGLTTLALIWGLENEYSGCSSRNADKEKQVFELLEPHQNIKEVEISGYGGISVPLWVGSLSMTNMTKIELVFCARVTTLPSFGLLPCLRQLEIKSMHAVCSVGSEFYGNVERPFQSLEILMFEDMRAWEAWSSSRGDKEIEEPFPRLIRLVLKKCPILVSNLSYGLCSLVDLKIQDCPLLQASPSMAALPSLKDLDILGCHYNLLAIITSVSTKTLKKISLESIQKLLYVNEDTLRLAEHLVIRQCDELIGLWEDNVFEAVGERLTRLKYLSIKECGNFQKLPNKMQRLTSLIEMTIEECLKLQSLPEEIMSCNLQKLCIRGCGSLEVVKLPTTLISFEVHRCEKLEKLLAEEIMSCNLEKLCITDCGSLEVVKLPTTLISFEVHRCEKLERLLDDSSASTQALYLQLDKVVIGGCNFRNIPHLLFNNLTELKIYACPYMEENMLLKLPSCLRSLRLHNCNNIKCLPPQMNTKLTSLVGLRLSGLSIECFPKGGLPLSIEKLILANCKKLKQTLKEWGLCKLTALKELIIHGEIGSLCLQEDMTSFPPLPSDWLLFPPNLENLELWSQPNMVSLSNGLRDHLTSLRQLYIGICPKLQVLPKEGFPHSLERLILYNCSEEMKSKCSKNGTYFHLVGSIPYIYFGLF